MTTTISQLWQGNVESISHAGINSAELRYLESLRQRNLEKLCAELNDKQKELFEKYRDAFDEYFIVYSEQSFCDGFCFGAKLVSEALTR